MSYIDNCYQIDHNIAGTTSDLQKMEDNFVVLKTTFSGASAPADCGDYTVVAGLCWYDTSNKQMKFRNAADSGWVYLFPGDANQKIWVYRNDVVEGMVYVNITDRVLATKGGTSSYAVNGGTLAGSTSFAHVHAAGSYTVNTYHRHSVGTRSSSNNVMREDIGGGWTRTDYDGASSRAITGNSSSANTTEGWRPRACIGILVAPDM